MQNIWRKRRKTCLSILLVVVCFVTSLSFLWIDAKADNVVRTGTVVVSGSLNFRKGPGTSYGVIGYLKNGDTGTVIDEGKDSNKTIWYKMVVNGTTGWASSKYVKVTSTVIKEDAAFDAYLDAQGFPDSYKPALQALHAQYPNWKFEAQITNLKWATVISEESDLGVNLVHKSAVSSWKSMETGAFDWENNEWEEFDSGGWVAASTEIIQYYMDPRNFLDSTNIFQFIKQSYDAGELSSSELKAKKSDLTNMVKGTYLAGDCDDDSYVDVIMNAAKKSGVCPFALASMMIQEQGKDGSGRSISGTVSGYKGYYNYLNIGAYKTSTFSSAVERGLWYAKGSGTGDTTYNRPWNTREKAIIGGAVYYGKQFVNVGQDTMYLKKFNVQGSNLYGHQYMTNVAGAASEGQHLAAAYDDNARKAELVFKIPVYKSMPSTACKKPTADGGNPNYMLKSLSVSGYSLTPTFNMYETSYTVVVPNSVTSAKITATAIASTSTVSGTGTKSNLAVGSNKFTVKVKAENGSTKKYTVNISRQKAANASGETVVKPSISTSSYTINNQAVTGITKFPLSVSGFLGGFKVSNGSAKITASNGKVKSSGDVGTGDQIRLYDTNGDLAATYTVVIYGDTNGDGKVSALDLLRIKKQIIGASALKDTYKTAGDTNKDGKISALDLLQVKKQIIGAGTIKQ